MRARRKPTSPKALEGWKGRLAPLPLLPGSACLRHGPTRNTPRLGPNLLHPYPSSPSCREGWEGGKATQCVHLRQVAVASVSHRLLCRPPFSPTTSSLLVNFEHAPWRCSVLSLAVKDGQAFHFSVVSLTSISWAPRVIPASGLIVISGLQQAGFSVLNEKCCITWESLNGRLGYSTVHWCYIEPPFVLN